MNPDRCLEFCEKMIVKIDQGLLYNNVFSDEAIFQLVLVIGIIEGIGR